MEPPLLSNALQWPSDCANSANVGLEAFKEGMRFYFETLVSRLRLSATNSSFRLMGTRTGRMGGSKLRVR